MRLFDFVEQNMQIKGQQLNCDLITLLNKSLLLPLSRHPAILERAVTF